MAIFYSHSSDGRIYKDAATWAAARGANSGTVDNASNWTYTESNDTLGGGTPFRISRTFLSFDTSDIPDDAVITSVVLKIYVSVVADEDNDGKDYLTIVPASPASPTALVANDYDNITLTHLIDAVLDFGSAGGTQHLTLNATGIAQINKTGYTTLAILEGHDFDNEEIAAGKRNTAAMVTSEYTGTIFDFRLTVNYTVNKTVTPSVQTLTLALETPTYLGTSNSFLASALSLGLILQPPSLSYPEEDFLKEATEAYTRKPSAFFRICWDRSQFNENTEWFRLDESKLDSGALLTWKSYLQGETMNEIIAQMDDYRFQDESSFIISLEGFNEFRGDNNQSSVAESDIVLGIVSGTSRRLYPHTNPNLLDNPSFESEDYKWTIVSGIHSDLSWLNQDESGLGSGIALRIDNDVLETPLMSSYPVEVQAGISYTGSIFAKGVGKLNLAVVASGVSGLISSGLLVDQQLDDDWNRIQESFIMPAESVTGFLKVEYYPGGSDDSYVVLDGAQLEVGDLTDFQQDFISDKILPRRPVKAYIDMNGYPVPIFAGLTESIEPNLRDDEIHFHLLDFASELDSVQAISEMYQNLVTSSGIQILAEQAGMTSGVWSIETGKHTIPFIWFQEGSVWWYMSQLAEAEGGRVFFDEEGVLHFWNRDHYTASGTGITDDFDFSDLTNVSFRIDKDEIKNHIIVKSTPREVQDLQQVYDHGIVEELEGGETKDIWARIVDVERNNEGMPCTSINEPTGGVQPDSYYTANAVSDGTGADKTSQIELKYWYGFAESAKMTFTNHDTSKVYITEIILNGTPAKVIADINEETEDVDSIAIYGRQTLQIENNFINSRPYAQTLATVRLDELKDPRTHLHAELLGRPYLQIGDLVKVQDDFSYGTISASVQILFVKSIRWQLLDDFIQNVEFEKKDVLYTWFILDESKLDDGKMLYI